ncbi:hypothetical protein [Streptomyces sp. NBC_00996]|uniref:hypothetical protein n=1 Tax=Streptomyces sp. NBC_00996 TaxID=2903710 RepID=UPI00386BCA9D|nr:hypothetical protein OG390_26210 [Streptomyces sp. NBC_00996]
MNTMEAHGLTLPRCCAHLMSWDGGPRTARTHTDAVPAGLSTRARASEPAAAVEPTVLRQDLGHPTSPRRTHRTS